MTSNYKYTRNWENQQKAIFEGVELDKEYFEIAKQRIENA